MNHQAETTGFNEQERAAYRSHAAASLWAARRYDGNEKRFQEVYESLLCMERFVEELGERIKGLGRIQREDVVANFCEAPSIDRVLEIASERFRTRLRRLLSKTDSHEAPNGLLRVRVNAVVLPPADGTPIQGDGIFPWEDAKFQERLHELLILLEANSIYIDDLIVIEGVLTPEMMREMSYRIIEIPRLQREVLLCDQVGEATFVVDGILPRGVAFGLSKEELQQRYGAQVRRVIYRKKAQWAEALQALLFSQWGEVTRPRTPGPKVEVRSAEEIRKKIMSQVTAAQWVRMTAKEKLDWKLDGVGLKAIARKFGVEGNPVGNHRVHIELGIRVFGEEEELVKALAEEQKKEAVLALTEDALRARIKEKTTAAQWVRMTQRAKLGWKLDGVGLIAMARKFGVEGDPINNHRAHIELGIRVFGEEEELVKALVEEEKKEAVLALTEDALRARIKEKTTAAQWVRMTQKEKLDWKLDGVGLNTIARKFGVEGNPVGNHRVHIELGIRVFGEISVPT